MALFDFISEYHINLVFRMIVSCMCGAVIGFERKNRAKEAGIRTHCIVACASAMMMIISKYGFNDLMTMLPQADVRLDPSRMAQGIVTGVGFLGSGMIYHMKGSTRGLTTAAGVWATSGIGMALGAGMYIIGIASTGLLLCTQYFLHTKNKFMVSYKSKTLKIHSVSQENFQEDIKLELEALGITVWDVSVARNEEGLLDYAFHLEMPQTVSEEELICGFEYKCSIDYIVD